MAIVRTEVTPFQTDFFYVGFSETLVLLCKCFTHFRRGLFHPRLPLPHTNTHLVEQVGSDSLALLNELSDHVTIRQ